MTTENRKQIVVALRFLVLVVLLYIAVVLCHRGLEIMRHGRGLVPEMVVVGEPYYLGASSVSLDVAIADGPSPTATGLSHAELAQIEWGIST